MQVFRIKPLLILFCLIGISACQQRKEQKAQENIKKQEEVYRPQKGRLLIISDIHNPEVKSVSLISDNEKDSITSVKPENGKFKLDVKDVNLHEIYFMKITGKSTKRGTSGLAWEALIPVLASPSKELALIQAPFSHIGSISKVLFSIQGGGEEQALLNDWHKALTVLEAEKEGQTEQYAIGGTGAIKVAGKKKLSKTPASIAEDFIGQHKPLITSFYLISRLGKQRQFKQAYQQLLDQASDTIKHSKYAIDLAKRLAQIQTKITQLDLEKQVVATDTRLSEIPWDSLKNRKYLLLSFWNSTDQASASTVKALENAVPKLAEKGIEVLPISMEDRFTTWKENTEHLGFKYNYRMRNEAQQELINTLYLSELPRLVLVKPDGKVVNDDFRLKQLEELE